MSYFQFSASLLSKGNVLLRCQENLSLDQFKYFLESMSKLLSYVVFDPFQKHCAFEPGDPDIDIAFTCVMSKGRFLDPVPKLNLHKETECMLLEQKRLGETKAGDSHFDVTFVPENDRQREHRAGP